MSNIFLYGTLCHLPLLEIVLGRNPDTSEWVPATLGDHRVAKAEGHSFPMLVSAKGDIAQGWVLSVTDEDLKRMNYYEHGFDYVLKNVSPAGWDAKVMAYFPVEGRWTAAENWTLDFFEKGDAAFTCAAAEILMSMFGRLPIEQVAARRDHINSMLRRASIIKGKSNQGAFPSSDVELLRQTHEHVGFFNLDSLNLRHRLFAGGMSQELRREVFISSDASIVLPYDPVNDTVLMVEQFRIGPFMRLDPSPWKLEPIAGRVDPGEGPERTAIREAKEESGVEIRDLISLGSHYASPGSTTDYFHCYLALADLSNAGMADGGKEDEGEDIRSYVIPFDRLMEMVDSFQIDIGPFLYCALQLARRRDELRAGA